MDDSKETSATTNFTNKGLIYYEHHFGKASINILKEIEYWSEQLSEEKVVNALSLSKTATYPMKYASKILTNWQQKSNEGEVA